MIIMASSLAAAINECRHIKPEEIITDTIISIKQDTENHKTEGGKTA